MDTSKLAMSALGIGNYALGYTSEGAGVGLKYAGKGLKVLGEIIENSGESVKEFGKGRIRIGELCLKVSSGNISEEEMAEFGFSDETIAEYKATKSASAKPATKPAKENTKKTATKKTGESDPNNGVMKDYAEGDEMSPADCAEAYC